MHSLRALTFGMALLLAPAAHAADPAGFARGPVIADYGPVADVPDAAPIPPGTHFKVIFDVSEAAADGSVNAGIESAARFLNMHARAGIPPENISIAIVVRGGAVRDLTTRPRPGGSNPNAPLAGTYLGVAGEPAMAGTTLVPRASVCVRKLRRSGSGGGWRRSNPPPRIR